MILKLLGKYREDKSSAYGLWGRKVEKAKPKTPIPTKAPTVQAPQEEVYIGNVSDKHHIELNFHTYRWGQIITVDGKRYVVRNHPDIDYTKKYLPFFLLVMKGYVEEL